MKEFENGFQSSNMILFREILNKHLANAATELGVKSVKLGNISYVSGELKAKIIAVSNSIKLNEIDLSTFEGKQYIGRYYKFVGKPTAYEIKGYNEAIKKFSIQTLRRGGKGYLLSIEQFQTMTEVK